MQNFNSRSYMRNDKLEYRKNPLHLRFNSRSCVRSDIPKTEDIFSNISVSIHAPMWGTTIGTAVLGCRSGFNSRSCVRSDMTSHERNVVVAFQFTLLREERPRRCVPDDIAQIISIHAPTWGATANTYKTESKNLTYYVKTAKYDTFRSAVFTNNKRWSYTCCISDPVRTSRWFHVHSGFAPGFASYSFRLFQFTLLVLSFLFHTHHITKTLINQCFLQKTRYSTTFLHTPVSDAVYGPYRQKTFPSIKTIHASEKRRQKACRTSQGHSWQTRSSSFP